MKTVLRNIGWFLASAGLYAALLGLEYHWNLFVWEPKLDLLGIALLLLVLLTLSVILFLALLGDGLRTRAVSLLLCLGLLALGSYVLPPEPAGSGFFAREAPSPAWYRAGRLFILALPSLFWVVQVRRSRLMNHPRTGACNPP